MCKKRTEMFLKLSQNYKVEKGDTIELSTNLPASTDWADKYFVQTGLLLYNDNYD